MRPSNGMGHLGKTGAWFYPLAGPAKQRHLRPGLVRSVAEVSSCFGWHPPSAVGEVWGSDMLVVTLLAAIGVILVGCEMFTNGVEWFGRHLNLGDGSVGSILAAVGTAMPETVIPIIAIVLGTSHDADAIGIGAIVGSSFMLGTLALFVTGVSVAVFSLCKTRSVLVQADPVVLERDLRYFVIAYGTTLAATLFSGRQVKLVLAFGLLAAYAIYVWKTIGGDEASDHRLRRLYLHPQADKPHLAPTVLQMVLALAIILVGARVFVYDIENLAYNLAVPALILSMLITPFATELPEKFNSVIWVRQGKDTLALGNITGAMVFQASVLPAVGIVLTSWQLTTPAILAASLGLLSAAAAYVQLRIRGSLHYRHLIGMGLLYAGYVVYALAVAA